MSQPKPPPGFELSAEWWEAAPAKDFDWLLYALNVLDKAGAAQVAALKAFMENERWALVPEHIKQEARAYVA